MHTTQPPITNLIIYSLSCSSARQVSATVVTSPTSKRDVMRHPCDVSVARRHVDRDVLLPGGDCVGRADADTD